MVENSDDITKRGGLSITCYTWKDIIKLIIANQYKTFFLSFITLFGALWLIIEVGNYYYPNSFLSNKNVFYLIIIISVIFSLLNIIIGYFFSEVRGLEGETKDIQKIALIRRPY